MHDNRLTDAESALEMASLMRLLSDPTRIRVLGLLRPGEMNVTALCAELDLAQPTVSHHLGLLRSAGLVQTRRDGKQIFYSLNPAHLDSGAVANGLRLHYGEVTMLLGSNGDHSTHPVSPQPAEAAVN
jgi:DNA-binding transcriptional ArsR family regulator